MAISSAGFAQEGDLRLLDWEPTSMLVVKETTVLQAKFPVIDIHNHLRDLSMADAYISEMDQAGIWRSVSLDGNSVNDFYKEHLESSRQAAGDRFIVFFRPDFDRIDEPGFGEREAARLEEAVRLGARGMKISKVLGLTVRDSSGQLVPVDDPRIDPIWAKCGELNIPVLIHVSDPKAFFTPLDRFNERYDELGAHPNWSYFSEEFPSKEEILAQRNRVFEKHPNTIFIAAHVATLPEDLHQVGLWLDMYPNMYVEIGARISDLGRQPYTARKFFTRYQDRILFGSDTAPNADAYRVYFRFLETDDEYFDPAGGHHRQARWMIYGLDLPDEILEKIYNKNALKLLDRFNRETE
jgi:predicted TIM-barrel fold metal-dependent hydrolase